LFTCENACMGAVEVQHYLNRARDFLAGMNFLLREEMFIVKDDYVQFKYSPALLGIHGAISYCDALRIGLGSDSLSSDDHRIAAKELKTLLSARKCPDQRGTEKLENLLGKTRSKVTYLPEPVDADDVKRIVQQAERFASWAESTGKKLRIEGWGND
jgi:hypothetical protein